MNFEVTRLLLTTAEGEPIAYRHYRVADDPAGLVILLPGVHYGADGPLLFYPAVALREAGWGIIHLAYRFQTDVSNFDPANLLVVLEDCRTAVEAAREQRSFPALVYIGKSLGAGLAAFLCADASAKLPTRGGCLTTRIGRPKFYP